MLKKFEATNYDADTLVEIAQHHLKYSLGKQPKTATSEEIFRALGNAIRQCAIEKAFAAEQRFAAADAKRVYYLSMEFLIGRLLGNNVINLGIEDAAREAAQQLGLSLDEIDEIEPDPALGNGGLGRLAACFLDSIATLDMPGYGYGINYEYGLFRQAFANGHQREHPDHWMASGTPWQIERTDESVVIPLYGRVERTVGPDGSYNPMWVDWNVLVGVPSDLPVIGYGGNTVNYLRLYSARSSDDFDMSIFNTGDYIKAVEQKISSENISKVLYPSDAVDAGKELRLIQEYFLVASSVRDILRKFFEDHDDITKLGDYVSIQLNDTHPALCVPELMRILIDEHDCEWEKAWQITNETLSYTNHTLLPEALEKWPVNLIEKVLPRHLELIFEINRRFLNEVEVKFPHDINRIQKMSIIEEGSNRQVRMANMAIIGSHSVNGVAAMHSELVKKDLVPEFYQMWPERFNNKTNGVTQRRWILKSNPALSELITETVGDGWITDLDQVRGIESGAESEEFRKRFMEIKQLNKAKLADYIHDTTRVVVDPQSLFDVQIKRIHEYKRQLLSVFYIIDAYLSMVEDGTKPTTPRTWVFGGKAAPGYYMAKRIIKLINNLADIINNDPRVEGMLKVAYVPDYRVSVAEKIVPAADLSEQISTAGFEASGTGNMKLSMNGALTIGTLDGANVEILEEVGKENIYIFGLSVEQVEAYRINGYNPRDWYNSDRRLARVLDAIRSDRFCPREPGYFIPIFDNLMNGGDFYLVMADFADYRNTQEIVGEDYLDQSTWAKKAILNVARMGKFSSDRTIQQYADDIWNVKRIPAVG